MRDRTPRRRDDLLANDEHRSSLAGLSSSQSILSRYATTHTIAFADMSTLDTNDVSAARFEESEMPSHPAVARRRGRFHLINKSYITTFLLSFRKRRRKNELVAGVIAASSGARLSAGAATGKHLSPAEMRDHEIKRA